MILKRNNVERLAVDDTQAEKLKKDGYVGISHEPAKDEGTAAARLEDMAVPELKSLAKEKGIEGAGSLTKAELLAVLKDVSPDDRH